MHDKNVEPKTAPGTITRKMNGYIDVPFLSILVNIDWRTSICQWIDLRNVKFIAWSNLCLKQIGWRGCQGLKPRHAIPMPVCLVWDTAMAEFVLDGTFAPASMPTAGSPILHLSGLCSPDSDWSSDTMFVTGVDHMPPADELFLAMGTSIKKAGGQQAFHAVD